MTFNCQKNNKKENLLACDTAECHRVKISNYPHLAHFVPILNIWEREHTVSKNLKQFIPTSSSLFLLSHKVYFQGVQEWSSPVDTR